MDFSKTETISEAIKQNLGLEVQIINEGLQAQFFIDPKDLLPICEFLYKTDTLYFDFLNCISAVDNGVEADTLDIIYHISSIPFGYSIALKIQIDRNNHSEIDSISHIWQSANWHEREIFDFFGVVFKNHPDLRRILLPADWEGHPMRKDYVEQEKYHGIIVKHTND